MAVYGEHKVSLKKQLSNGETDKYTFTAVTIPDGEVFYRIKITNSQGYGSSMQLQKPAASTGWNSWTTDKSVIKWTNGGKPTVSVHNGTGSTASLTVNIIFQTKYTKVVKGNKIMANDRGKSGTTTKAGNVMKDDNYSSGTLITASSFNSKYGYNG